MKPRLLIVTLIAFVLITVGLASGETPELDQRSLVKIALRDEKELALVEAAAVPVYARLTGTDNLSYLLVGAPLDQVWPHDLDLTVLDKDMRGATFVFAYPMPERPRPAWQEYGELLLDDGVQALLRISPEESRRFSSDGVEFRTLTLDPKPLRLAPAEGTIPVLAGPDPLVQQMVDQVESATVYSYTGELSGEWPVDVGGSPYTITTRHTYSNFPIQKATQYVGEHLAGLGLDVEFHQWGGATYPNVIGELVGSVSPEDIYIIGAYLDDMPSGSIAPGADDNASGSVATLIAADILTQYPWGCTLRFAFWTGEEQWLLGSNAYVARAFSQDENIIGYLNLDMIGYNSPDSQPNIDLHADVGHPETLVLAQLFADVVDAYGLDLFPEIVPNGTGASDHASFWEYGYTAILGIEDFGDFNPNYHTTADLLQNLDIAYYTDFVRASVGTFVHMSDCLVGYLDGQVTDAEDGNRIPGAQVRIGDAIGRTFSETTDITGYYSSTLLADTYTVTVQADGYLSQTMEAIGVIAGRVTTQDFSLVGFPFRVYLPINLRADRP